MQPWISATEKGNGVMGCWGAVKELPTAGSEDYMTTRTREL